MARHISLDVKVPKKNASARTWRRWMGLSPFLEVVHANPERNWN